jgi:DNA-binding Lrp family transcriptional regulator
MTPESSRTITIDRLDRRLIHALLHDGRTSFRRLGDVLGASEQTVARRYRRLREAGVLRVVVVPDPRRYPENLFLRIRCRPGAAVPVGRAVAARPDISWVMVAAGASEITCSLRTTSPADRDALLLQGLPRAGQVTGLTTATLLHFFADGGATEWHGLPDGLDAAEREALGGGSLRHRGIAAARSARTGEPAGAPLGPEDADLLRVLAGDGRASWTALAAATGRTEAQVSRRLEALLAAGAVYVDVELAPVLLGFRTWAMLWISAAPGELHEVGDRIARHPETAYVAAVTGTSNLVASVLCRDSDELYGYLTRRIGPIPGVRDLEVVPAMRMLKQQGSLMDGDRLPDPLAGPA